MATPTKAADTLEAWRQNNFGWMTRQENVVLKRIIERLRRNEANRLRGER